jgi:hypothetical protein
MLLCEADMVRIIAHFLNISMRNTPLSMLREDGIKMGLNIEYEDTDRINCLRLGS